MKHASLAIALAVTTAIDVTSAPAFADTFSYDTPGKLVSGSGKGRVDNKVYAPGIRFPIESGPAFANSQVWGHGGGSGPGGSQCDKENFSYPWHDNYCETRDWDMPLCPSGAGHQGQDVRASDCTKGVHWTVAVTDGTITNIGSYSVYLTAADGTRFDYLHMQDVAVKVGQKVKRGDHMGKVSNQFDGTPTTVHLHFNIRQNVAGVGAVYVPPYFSLIDAYEVMLGIRPDPNAADAGADASPPPKDPPPPPPAPTSNAAPLPPAATEPEDTPPADAEEGGCAVAEPSRAIDVRASAFGIAIAVVGISILRRRKPRQV